MSTEAPELPNEMRAAQVASFGGPSEITVTTIPIPPAPNRNQLLIKVQAVSLSPSDYRILTGACSLVKKPPKGKFPYIPGGDISGTVYKTHPSEHDYKLGDKVFATWEQKTLGFGGLAEFVVVEKKLVETIPDDVSFLEAAAMANSPVNAMLAIEDAGIKHGERVLILGGSGGVGTALIQCARFAGASFIAATSTDQPLVSGLGADIVIDYTTERWYERSDFQHDKFDVVIDMAEGATAWEHCGKVLKSGKEGGRFVAGVVNEWYIEIKTVPQFVRWGMKPLSRSLKSRWYRRLPKYTMLFPAPRKGSMDRFLELRKKGLKIVMDPRTPWTFSTNGVRQAFEVMIARKGHGKVVIAVGEAAVAEDVGRNNE